MDMVIQLVINALTLGLTYVLVALGVTVIFSIMGIVNFAHGEFYMIGAFVVYVLVMSAKVNFFVALVAAVVVVGILGIAAERVLFRRFRGQELNGLVLSLGISILLQNVAFLVWGGDDHSVASPFRASALRFLGASISADRIVAMVISLLMLGLLYLFINKTKTGQAMQAVAQDGEAAALQGVSINHISAVSFFTGCALAGLAGALLAPIFYVSPYIGSMPVLKAFVVTVLGGLGSIPGALIGGLLLGVIDSVCLFFLGTLGDMAGFVILILVILFKPTGILGEE